MLSHGKFARSITVLVGLTFVAMPVNITFKGWRAKISWTMLLLRTATGRAGGTAMGTEKIKEAGEGAATARVMETEKMEQPAKDRREKQLEKILRLVVVFTPIRVRVT